MCAVKRHLKFLVYFAAIHLCFHEISGTDQSEQATTYYAAVGTDVSMSCRVGGNKDGAAWLYQYDKLAGRDRYYFQEDDLVLRVSDVRLGDAGTYQCVSNDGGRFFDLIIIEMSEPRVIRLKALNFTHLKVSWAAPLKDPDYVEGYRIYATPLGRADERKEYKVDQASQTKKESIVLQGLEPGVKYKVKLLAVYRDGLNGNERTKGPVSGASYEVLPDLPQQEVDIRSSADVVEAPPLPSNDSPSSSSPSKIFVSFLIPKPSQEPQEKEGRIEALKPKNVAAKPDGGTRIVVTWELHVSPRPADLVSFNVAFRAKKRKGRKGKKIRLPASGEMNVSVPVETSSLKSSWRTVISGLKPKFQYVIEVTPILASGFGLPALPVTVLLEEESNTLPRQLSIRAMAMGPNSALVTFKVLGKGKLSKIKLWYFEDGATMKTKARIPFGEKQTTVTGLKPKTTYFFFASMKLARKRREAATHVVTPPSDLSPPSDVTVTPMDGQKIMIRWQHTDYTEVVGYRVTLERQQEDKSFRVYQDNTTRMASRNTVLAGLQKDSQYRVTITPYAFEGPGDASEPVLFRVSEDGTMEVPVEAIKPEFETEIPQQMSVARGERLDLACTARGTPTPQVSWYVNDAAEPTGASGMGSNSLVLDPVDGPLGVICVANNSAGTIFAPVRVTVFEKRTDEPSEPLQFTSDLPELQPVVPGGDVTLNCSATGSPKPNVRWYKDGDLIAQAGPEDVFALFHEVDITANFTVRCVVSNDVQLIAAEVQVFNQVPESISVEAYVVPLSESKVLVNWIVTHGELDTISGFNAVLYDHDDNQLVEVELGNKERSLPLDNFAPGARFKFVLKTLTSEGLADEDQLDITIQIPDPGTETELHIDVVEVREDQARINFRVTGPERDLVESFRLKINHVTSEGARENEQIIIVNVDQSSLVVDNLKPQSPYEVFVSAMSNEFQPMVNESVQFKTSTPGRSGSLVLSELTSDEMAGEKGKTCPECPVCPTLPPPPTCGTAATTVDAVTANQTQSPPPLVDESTLTPDITSEAPIVSTAEPEVSSLPAELTTQDPIITSTLGQDVTTPESTSNPVTTSEATVTTESPDDKTFVLATRLLGKSPSGMKLAWLVERGNLDRVHSFVFKLSSGSGHKLVESNVQRRARTLSLASLRPKSTYIVNIKARDSAGEVLAESEFTVTTLSKDETPDSSHPKLYLEANEIRKGQLRLIWALQDAGSLKASSFRMRVIDGRPDGSVLLNRKIHPNRTNFLLQNLPPNRQISIIMDAMGPNNQALLSSVVTFKTPANGSAVKPVFGTPLSS